MKPERAALTLVQAEDAWRGAKGHNTLTAANLLLVATVYWNDDMISDETYGEIVTRVARDLQQSVGG